MVREPRRFFFSRALSLLLLALCMGLSSPVFAADAPAAAPAPVKVDVFSYEKKDAGGALIGYYTDKGTADADKDNKNAKTINNGDTAWMMTSAALVLMMTGPGLALFYSGLVRRKNVLATMMQSFILMAVVSILWAFIGYSLAFAEGNPFIGGLRFAFLREVGTAPSEYAATIPHQLWMVYQCMFAVITPALICGAYAERMKFSSMLMFLAALLSLSASAVSLSV
jgi:Amt family ammonium transporter